jgi:hypothetical protein
MFGKIALSTALVLATAGAALAATKTTSVRHQANAYSSFASVRTNAPVRLSGAELIQSKDNAEYAIGVPFGRN